MLVDEGPGRNLVGLRTCALTFSSTCWTDLSHKISNGGWFQPQANRCHPRHSLCHQDHPRTPRIHHSLPFWESILKIRSRSEAGTRMRSFFYLAYRNNRLSIELCKLSVCRSFSDPPEESPFGVRSCWHGWTLALGQRSSGLLHLAVNQKPRSLSASRGCTDLCTKIAMKQLW